MPAFVPHPIHLRDDPDALACAVTLGLTVAFAEPLDLVARGGPAALLRRFFSLAAATAPHRPRWVWTSAQSGWRALTPSAADELCSELGEGALGRRPRHLFSLRIADRRSAPSTAFRYVEVDPDRSARPTAISITLPAHCDPALLEAMLRAIASEHPLFAALGGFEVSVHPAAPGVGLRAAYPWFRRFLALQPPGSLMLDHAATRALPGVSWLTAIGLPLSARLKQGTLTYLARHEWSHDVALERLPTALVVRAGAQPTLGDLNHMEYPFALAEVARAVAPLLAAVPPALPGRFYEEGATGDWLHRFEAPERWS